MTTFIIRNTRLPIERVRHNNCWGSVSFVASIYETLSYIRNLYLPKYYLYHKYG